MTHCRYIFDITCECIRNCYIDIASPLRCAWSNEDFSKTIIFVQKLLLRLIIFPLTLILLLFVINCKLWLLNLYSLVQFPFLTSHNINIPNGSIFWESFFSSPYIKSIGMEFNVCEWNYIFCWHVFHSIALFNYKTNWWEIFFLNI